MSEQTDAARLAEAERYFRRLASGCEHFGSTQMAIALMAEYDARADRGASLGLEERAHAATSAEVARLEAENARLRAFRDRVLARCDEIDAEHQAKPFNEGETYLIGTDEVRRLSGRETKERDDA